MSTDEFDAFGKERPVGKWPPPREKQLVVRDYPPNYFEIMLRFKLPEGVVFAWGDIIYSPDSGVLPGHILVHEMVHCRQQGNAPQEWWMRYLTDDFFRLGQELEAYRTEYLWLLKEGHKQKARDRAREAARLLASEMYGGVASEADAFEEITKPRSASS